MSCSDQDYVINIGTDWSRTIIISNQSLVPDNLTDYDFKMQIRKPHNSELLVELAVDSGIEVTPLDGKLVISVTPAQSRIDTVGLALGSIIEFTDDEGDEHGGTGWLTDYALEATHPDGKIERLLSGKVCFTKEICYG